MMNVNFKTENAAFWTEEVWEGQGEELNRAEIARIMRQIAAQVENGSNNGNIYDICGNFVGKWIID